MCCPLLDDALHYIVRTRSSPFPAPPLWSSSVLRAFLPSKQKKRNVRAKAFLAWGDGNKPQDVNNNTSDQQQGTDGRSGRPTSDPVILSGATFQQGLPGESIDVSGSDGQKRARFAPGLFPLSVFTDMLCCWLLRLTRLYFTEVFTGCFNHPANACLLSVSIIYISLHIFFKKIFCQ